MAVSLTRDIRESESQETLTVVEQATRNGKVLAVCEASGGTLVLARERTRPVADADGKRPRKDASGKPRATEPYWKRTADLADLRDAVAAGLIEF